MKDLISTNIQSIAFKDLVFIILKIQQLCQQNQDIDYRQQQSTLKQQQQFQIKINKTTATQGSTQAKIKEPEVQVRTDSVIDGGSKPTDRSEIPTAEISK